jgi:hypothetical protein
MRTKICDCLQISKQENKFTYTVHGYTNAFFPNYVPANLITISSDIVTYGGSYLSRRAAKACRKSTSDLQIRS